MFQKSDKKNYIKSLCIIFYDKMTRYSRRFLNYIKSKIAYIKSLTQ